MHFAKNKSSDCFSTKQFPKYKATATHEWLNDNFIALQRPSQPPDLFKFVVKCEKGC